MGMGLPQVLWVLMETLRYIGIVSQPITPSIASALLDQVCGVE